MKKMYKNPQTETVQFAAGELMGAVIGGSPIPGGGEAAAPSRNSYHPF